MDNRSLNLPIVVEESLFDNPADVQCVRTGAECHWWSSGDAGLTSRHQVDAVRVHSQTGHCVQVGHHGVDQFACKHRGDSAHIRCRKTTTWFPYVDC